MVGTGGRQGTETPRARARPLAVRILRMMVLCADGATVLAAMVGREDAVACAGALSAAFRAAAELMAGRGGTGGR
ncbi:hypothetical protein GCM10027605_74170 [Micromonospora zhanjiangensis]